MQGEKPESSKNDLSLNQQELDKKLILNDTTLDIFVGF